jgi:hypothetical protein
MPLVNAKKTTGGLVMPKSATPYMPMLIENEMSAICLGCDERFLLNQGTALCARNMDTEVIQKCRVPVQWSRNPSVLSIP